MTFDVKDSTVTLTVVPQTAGKKGENPVVTEFTVSPTVPSTVTTPTKIGLFLVSASKGTAAGVAMTGADTAEWIPAGTGSEYASTAVFMRKCPAAAEGGSR